MQCHNCRSGAPPHELLADEIRRVITSPYASSLKHLHRVVVTIDGSLLQQWAEDHPCQINSLVRITLEGLEHSSHALSVLEKLAGVGPIRDEVMRRRPTLLDTLLRKASTGGQNAQYAAACIMLLGKPLPVAIAIPDAVLPFLSRLLRAAIESPSVSAIRNVYGLLTPRHSSLVEDVPTEIVRALHDRLLMVLKHSDQQLVNLLCLGVFARLVSGHRSRCDSDSGKPPAELNDNDSHRQLDVLNIGSIEKFFNELKGPKTIQLVVLRVISACSDSSQTSLHDALETLSLAIEIVNTVEPTIKRKWIEANDVTIQKLRDKISRATLPLELQSRTLEFVLSLTGSEPLPPVLTSIFQNVVLNTIRAPICCSPSTQISTRVLEAFIGRVDDGFLYSALREGLVASIDQMKFRGASMRRTRFVTELVRTFSRMTPHLPMLGSSILRALSSEDVSEPLHSFTQFSLQSVPLSKCPDFEICPIAAVEARRELCLSLCSLVLQVIIQGMPNDTRIEYSLSLKLLEKQREYALPSALCTFDSRASRSMTWGTIPFLEQISTPADPSISHNWGERLVANLLTDAKYKHETLVRMVGEVCRDLENRCSNVEAPFREEQARAAKLSEELQAAQCQASRLQSELQDQRLLLNSREFDRAQLKEEVKLLNGNAQDAAQEIQQLHNQLRTVSRDAELAMSAANERAEQRELEHLAILNVKEEAIEDLQARVNELEKSLHDAGGELERQTQDYIRVHQKVDMLEDKVESQTKEMELHDARIVEQAERIRVLNDLEQNLRKKLEAANNDSQQSAAEREALRVKLDHTEKSLSVQIENMTRARDSDATEAIAKEAQLRQQHQHEIHDLKAEADLERHGMAMDRQRKDSRILELEEKIERFKRERAAKAKEFAEAQDLGRRLLAVVGANTTKLAPHSSAGDSLSFDEDSFALFASQRRAIGRADPPTHQAEPRPEHSSQDSLTPKRHRQRKSQNMPTLRQVKVVGEGAKRIDPIIPPNALLPSKARQPLEEPQGGFNRGGSVVKSRAAERHFPIVETGNKSPMRQPYHVENHTDRGDDMRIDTLSSFNDDFLTSTQKQDASDHRFPGSDGFSDETTMEF
ncbi:MAG: hypothetical protein M1816_008272 [Peltula sp. TS41687]|nr:MAG: hypothetical protein M1816_008272 [Peltula sp. TS41687]